MESIQRYGVHTPRKKHGALTAVLVILAVLLAAAGIVSWLVFSDPYAGRGLEKIQPSDELPQTLAKSVLSRQKCSFSTDEVNGYLAYLFQKQEEGKAKSGVQLQAIAVSGASGDNADLYLPVVASGKRFGVSLNVTPSLSTSSGRLLFHVNSVHIGKLSVPVGWALKKAESRIPKGFTRDGDTVSCAAPSLTASLLNVSASAGLTECMLENGALKLAAKAKITVG